MPDDGVSNIPVPIEGEKETAMDLSPSFGTLLHNQLAQSGVVAQNNFITVQKLADYDYLENKRMVTLDEAIGVREVAAEKSPGGPAKAGS